MNYYVMKIYLFSTSFIKCINFFLNFVRLSAERSTKSMEFKIRYLTHTTNIDFVHKFARVLFASYSPPKSVVRKPLQNILNPDQFLDHAGKLFQTTEVELN